jgi:ribosomal protein S18 acetylase RimI-like enzyme
MTREEFADWREYGTEQFARAWAQRGIPEEVARERSRRDNEVLLPQGPDTGDMRFSVVEHEGRPVGTLWLALRAQDAYIYDVEVYAAHRGRGHGRTLMLVAEAQTIASGRQLLGLNVFADNTPAERLYESLGYETTRYNFYKPLL